MRPTDVSRLALFRDGVQAGVLERTAAGWRFVPEPDSPLADAVPPRIGFRFGDTTTEAAGVNLPPFFANLLPEGLRFAALVGCVRTSVDDLFSLLAEVGQDCVGDVSAVPDGQAPGPVVPEVASAADGLDFAETAERLRTDANRVAIAGAQPKLSAAMVTLPTADRHGILKLEPPEYPNLALNEAATMSRARRAGIVTASARVVQDKAGRNGLHVRRFDRIVRRGQVVGRIHVEDGCQLCDLYPADKYRIGLRELAEAVTEFSSSPRREVLGLLRTVAFSYLVGNADLHAKNFSVWVRPGTRIVELSPAYDLVCTLVFSHLDTRMALRMLGKDDKLSLRDFVEFGSRFQVPERAVGQAVGEVLAATTDWDDELPGFAPTEADVRRAASVLRDRRRRLGA